MKNSPSGDCSKDFKKIKNMEDNIEQLRLSIVDLICVTINDVKEDIKELNSREKLNVILKLLPYVCDNNEVKKSLKQFVLNMRNRKKNA